MPKFCVTIGEERRYYCDVMVDANSATAAKAKVEAAIEDDLLDFPTGPRYATSDKSIVCIDDQLDCTTHIEVLEATKISSETVKKIMAQLEEEGGLKT